MNPNHFKQQIDSIPVPPELRLRSQLGIELAIAEHKEDRRQRSKRVKRTVGTIAAALAFFFLSATLLNHNYVWATLQKALQFVPGIGIVKEEDSPSERYILQKPITLNVGEGSIIITGIMSDEEMTYITMTGEHTPGPKRVVLVNEQGIEYTLDRTMASLGLDDWNSGFWYKGNVAVAGSMNLVMDLDPRVEVPITLTKADTFSSYPEMGETVAVNGVSITAIPDRVGEKARVSLVARHSEDFVISDYGIYGVYPHSEDLKLNVTDSAGWKKEIENVRGLSSPASEFYFELSEGESSGYLLTLPEISVTYKDEVSVRIPTEAKDKIDQTFEIAGFPVTITKTERTLDNLLRVYVDLHYDDQAAASLFSFNIDGLSSAAKLNEHTGAVEYIEFAVVPGSKQMKLKLTRPEVVIRGPWQFALSAEGFPAPNE